MTENRRKRPRDTNQLAKLIVDIATGDVEDQAQDAGATSAAAEMGRRGGLVGGHRRADALSPERRSEIAKAAARARWDEDSE
jgi:hypothetical protein